MQLKLRTNDLCEFLRNTTEGFEPEAQDKGIQLILALPVGKLPVRIDEAPAGRCQSPAQREQVHALGRPDLGEGEPRRPRSRVRVEDTGIGIAPEMLPRLFDLFSRGQSAQEAEPSALGIGLAVVREVVELHGGTVQARSPGEGKGSEFTVRLSAVDAEPETPELATK